MGIHQITYTIVWINLWMNITSLTRQPCKGIVICSEKEYSD
jgi:hypothetical protein